MSAPKTVRILLADDHPILRDGLRIILQAEPGFCVIGDAADGVQALQLARELNPDILLLDIAMPKCSGLEVLRDLGRSQSSVHVIVLAAEVESRQLVEVFQLGAWALVMKEWATEELIESIHSVMQGRYWVGHETVAELVKALRDLRGSSGETKPRRDFGLTPRELEIIEMIFAAYGNKDIAERFSISEDTVKRHVTHIFDKVGVSNRLELALFAIHNRLVSDSRVNPSGRGTLRALP